MMHTNTARAGFIGALALLVAGLSPAFAQPLRLSDTITLRAGKCTLVSDATDRDGPAEKGRIQRCTVVYDPTGMVHVTVPGNPDETIVFAPSIKPDGTLTAKGREMERPVPYDVTITGKVRPGTQPPDMPKATGVIRVWELPSNQ